MVGVTFSIGNLQQIRQALRMYPSVALREYQKAITESLQWTLEDAAHEAPVDTGKLRQSMRIDWPAPLRGRLLVNSKYGLYVETGRAPGGRMPPPGELAGWARRHGIPEFLVARSIQQKGVKPNPFLERAIANNKVFIRARFLDAMENIAAMVK